MLGIDVHLKKKKKKAEQKPFCSMFSDYKEVR